MFVFLTLPADGDPMVEPGDDPIPRKGAGAFERASSSPKSVSPEMFTRCSSSATPRISLSEAVAIPWSRTCLIVLHARYVHITYFHNRSNLQIGVATSCKPERAIIDTYR